MGQKKILGLEFGSTRIKSVLIDESGVVLALGTYDWENQLVDGLWSYDPDQAIEGMQESFRALVKNYGEPITELDAIGISGMMHGYLAFDADGKLLVPFRTWRNTNAEAAAEVLSEAFSFHLPMRWSAAQYYQSVLDGMSHVTQVAHLNTLAGYMHYLLTGRRVLGVGDASGMFPIEDGDYSQRMLDIFGEMLERHGVCTDFKSLLPQVLSAGEDAGILTQAGALLLDPTGVLQAGCPFCPPEGDMQTGMVCTNTVKPHSANASLGTSANITVVLAEALRRYHPEIDVIMTPDGYPAALVHANTCTSVIDTWVGVFGELLDRVGATVDRSRLFRTLFESALASDADVGGVAAYNFLAAEPLAGVGKGIPTVFVGEGGKLTLSNLMQAEIFGAIATLGLGLDILSDEGVKIQRVFGHGGFFKTPIIGQSALSALVKAPVTVTETASEGGAYGIALLALYTFSKTSTLADFLDGVFANMEKSTLMADAALIGKFDRFMENYKKGLAGIAAL